MGKTYSRNSENKGDPQVNIINSLEQHTGAHEEHEVKLWLLLTLVTVLLLLTIHREYARRVKKRAIINARSIVRLNEV